MAEPEEAVDMVDPVVQMEDILQHLKLLDYETEFCAEK